MPHALGVALTRSPDPPPEPLLVLRPRENGHYSADDLAKYLDTKIDPQSEAAIHAHIQQCAECRDNAALVQGDTWSRIKFPGF